MLFRSARERDTFPTDPIVCTSSPAPPPAPELKRVEEPRGPELEVMEEAGSPEDRLRQLKRLHENGLITDEDYSRKKSEILDSL